MKNKGLFLFLIASVAFSCQDKAKNKTTETFIIEEEHVVNKDSNHWTYEGESGPEHWSEIEKQSDCNGNIQSPIDIVDIDVIEGTSLSSLKIHYLSDVKIHNITNNGHSIQYNAEKGDYITLNDEKYDLKQVHFHEASEHTINGVRYPLEMHMVHISESKEISVLAIMVQEGENSYPFSFLEKYLPIKKGETKQVNANFNLNLNLPESKEYYEYNGSLTTPPCTQNVHWFIFKSPLTVSAKQVKLLQELMPVNNYRGLQPLNGRKVSHNIITP